MHPKRLWLLPFLVISLFALGARAQATPMTDAAKKVAAELRSSLAKDKAFKGLELKTDAVSAPCSLTFVRAFAVGAYPGSGVYGVLLDADGATYGKRGKKDFADLVRAHGWLENAPETRKLVRLANMALWDDMLAVDDSEAAAITKKDGVLTITFQRRTFPSGVREKVVVMIEKTGSAKTEMKSAD